MVSIPPEMLEEMNLQVGQDILLTSEGGEIQMEP